MKINLKKVVANLDLFMSEKRFLNYMDSIKKESSRTEGISLISVNVSSFRPKMSTVFISKEFIFAAKYNDGFAFYSDGFFVERKDIQKYHIKTGTLNDRLVIETTLKTSAGKSMELVMNFSKTMSVNWHQKNLKRLREFIE